MAVEAAKEAGLENVASVASVVGGIKAWMKAGGPVVYDETISQDAGGT
jgi:rhodanese-related sulfurtransferase